MRDSSSQFTGEAINAININKFGNKNKETKFKMEEHNSAISTIEISRIADKNKTLTNFFKTRKISDKKH